MTEAPGGSRAEWERRLVHRSLQDEEFRQRLLDDPKGTIEQELGGQLPEGVEVRAVEESADTIYLVLPSAWALGEGVEISDQDLEQVAGGVDHTAYSHTCDAHSTCAQDSGTCGIYC
jgi:Nitrile hydratase, alpha chain